MTQLAQFSHSDLLANYEAAVIDCTDRSDYAGCEQVRLLRREIARRLHAMTVSPGGAP